ncbi:MAG: 3'-5' exonuclease [Saprospiraceae bacterium]|jgi:hypothetical protein
MSYLDTFDLYNILFLDIETVPASQDFDSLPESMQELWGLKCRSLLRKPMEEISYDEMVGAYDRAGIYAEFGRIVCISVGFLTKGGGDDKPKLRVKSFAHHDEKTLLKEFNELLDNYFNSPDRFAICGHNIREFDVPYICRRIMVNQLPFPRLLDIAGKKPWETKHLLDTMELWKFGDIKNYTSLKLLAAVFGFPSPKDDIDGGDVAYVYWEERDLERIATYCEKDVVATVQLYLKMKRLPLLDADQVIPVGR